MGQKPNIFQHPDLDGSTLIWEGNSTGILLFHGFTATTVEVRKMAEFLKNMGFTIAAPLLPGHGKTLAEMNRVFWGAWLDTAETFYADLQTRCKKIFVLGESMGGLLTLELAANHPETTGIMVFAPALIIPNLVWSRLIWPFKQYMFKKDVDESMDWQGFNVVPMHAASELLQLQTHVKRSLSKVVAPALIFQGKLDRSIDPASSVLTLESISSMEKKLIWMENSTHCILIDKEHDIAQRICLDFIDAH